MGERIGHVFHSPEPQHLLADISGDLQSALKSTVRSVDRLLLSVLWVGVVRDAAAGMSAIQVPSRPVDVRQNDLAPDR